MSRIHYFQRYSSAENTVTNNTLLLIARIAAYSQRAASTLLSDLTGESIEIGIEVAQQQRAMSSVPDGAILQRSFKILIESKVDAAVSEDQLLRHADSFGRESQKVLLLLTKIQEFRLAQTVATRLRDSHPDVIFKNVTYEDICRATQSLFREHESEMLDLVEDYAEYCNDAKLFDQARFLLRVVPCGKSFNLNFRNGVYFHPSDRGYTEHRFVGMYQNKAVRAVMEPQLVVDVTLAGDNLTKDVVHGQDNGDFDDRIRKAIAEAKQECGYELATGTRFFCGEIRNTNFVKVSAYGIQGPRLIDLSDYVDTSRLITLDSVAVDLQDKEWQ